MPEIETNFKDFLERYQKSSPKLAINLKQLIREKTQEKVLPRETVLRSIRLNKWNSAVVGLLWAKAEMPKTLGDLEIIDFEADYLARFLLRAQLEIIYQAEILATPKDWFEAQIKEKMRLGMEYPSIDLLGEDLRECPLPEPMVQVTCPSCWGIKTFSEKCSKCQGTGIQTKNDGKTLECIHCRNGSHYRDCVSCDAHGYVDQYRVQGRRISPHTIDLFTVRIDRPERAFEKPTEHFLPIWSSPIGEDHILNVQIEDFQSAAKTLTDKLGTALNNLKEKQSEIELIMPESSPVVPLPYYKRGKMTQTSTAIKKYQVVLEIVPIYHVRYIRHSKYKIGKFLEKPEAHRLKGDIWLTGWTTAEMFNQLETSE